VVARDLEFVPAHVRHLAVHVEPDVGAGDEIETGHLAFPSWSASSLGEEHLHPETDPEEGTTGVGVVGQRLAKRTGVLHPSRNAPTPGRTTPSASANASGSSVISTDAPAPL